MNKKVRYFLFLFNIRSPVAKINSAKLNDFELVNREIKFFAYGIAVGCI